MNNKYLTVKELPLSERPYEKCEKYGAAYLSDAELLAVIIKTGSKNVRSIDLAHHILNYSKANKGLIGLNYMSMNELMSIKGIGKVKAIQLLCIAELAKRMAKASNQEGLKLLSPEAVANYYMQDMRHMTTEQILVVFIDSKSKVLGDMVISTGTVNSSIVAPREIFLNALKHQATYIIMLHNHPSGDPTPSGEDISVTKKIKKVCDFLDIELLDHLISTKERTLSFVEEGYLIARRETKKYYSNDILETEDKWDLEL